MDRRAVVLRECGPVHHCLDGLLCFPRLVIQRRHVPRIPKLHSCALPLRQRHSILRPYVLLVHCKRTLRFRWRILGLGAFPRLDLPDHLYLPVFRRVVHHAHGAYQARRYRLRTNQIILSSTVSTHTVLFNPKRQHSESLHYTATTSGSGKGRGNREEGYKGTLGRGLIIILDTPCNLCCVWLRFHVQKRHTSLLFILSFRSFFFSLSFLLVLSFFSFLFSFSFFFVVSFLSSVVRIFFSPFLVDCQRKETQTMENVAIRTQLQNTTEACRQQEGEAGATLM